MAGMLFSTSWYRVAALKPRLRGHVEIHRHSYRDAFWFVPPDTRELFRRFQRQRRQTWRQRLWTPLAIRVPLFDPDRFLERTAFLVRPLFGWLGALLWLSVVSAGLVLAGLNWSAHAARLTNRYG